MAAKIVVLEVMAEIRDGYEVELLIDGQFYDGWEFSPANMPKGDYADALAWVGENYGELEEQAENEWRQCQYDEK